MKVPPRSIAKVQPRSTRHSSRNGGRLNRFSLDAGGGAKLKRRSVAGLAQMVEQRFCKPKVAGSIPASGTLNSELVTYPQAYAPFAPAFRARWPILALANRFGPCSNNQVVAVFGSKHRGLRTGARRDKDQNHGAPDTSVSGAYSFPAPRHPLAGPFFRPARSRSRNISDIFRTGWNRMARSAVIALVVQLFGGEPWSPGYFGNRGLLVSGAQAVRAPPPPHPPVRSAATGRPADICCRWRN